MSRCAPERRTAGSARGLEPSACAAHPAGPRHARTSPARLASAPPRSSSRHEALHALDPRVWPAPRSPSGDASAARRRRIAGRRRPRPRGRVRHPAVRPRRGRLPIARRRVPRGLRRRRRARRRLLRRQGVPLRAASPAGSRRRGSASTSAPAASCSPRCAPASPPSASPSTATTRASPSSSSPSTPASAGTSSTRSRRSSGSRRQRPVARRRGRRPGPGHRRRRGAHPRVHRHRARGPEVRPLARRAARPRRPCAGSSSCRRCASSACTRTSARRSSTPPASRCPRTGSSASPPAVRDEHGIEVAELDLGGGMGIAYTRRRRPDDAPKDDGRPAARHRRPRVRARTASPCRGSRSSPGARSSARRWSRSTRSARSSRSTSASGHARAYVSVDGGMSDNIRTALYDAEYTVRLVSRVSEAAPVLSRVVGKHCESGDIVVRDCWLPGRPRAGRPARRRRHRRLLPRDGLQLQPRARARRWSSVRDGARRAGAAPRDARRPAGARRRPRPTRPER